MKPYVSSHLKDMNRRNVYELLCKMEETSKAELSHITGISPPTVMKIIQFLAEKELVTELGKGEAALGRKPQMLRLNKNRYYFIGAIHEGDFLRVGISNLKNELVALKKIRVHADFKRTMEETLFQVINELLVENEVYLSDVLGIGLGLPGIYDVEREKILTAPLIGISGEMEIGPILRKIEAYYHKSVSVDNDLNMDVLGEFLDLELRHRHRQRRDLKRETAQRKALHVRRGGLYDVFRRLCSRLRRRRMAGKQNQSGRDPGKIRSAARWLYFRGEPGNRHRVCGDLRRAVYQQYDDVLRLRSHLPGWRAVRSAGRSAF